MRRRLALLTLLRLVLMELLSLNLLALRADQAMRGVDLVARQLCVALGILGRSKSACFLEVPALRQVLATACPPGSASRLSMLTTTSVWRGFGMQAGEGSATGDLSKTAWCADFTVASSSMAW